MAWALNLASVHRRIVANYSADNAHLTIRSNLKRLIHIVLLRLCRVM